MRNVLTSIEAEYRRYQALAEAAMAQLSDLDLCETGPGGGNSIVVIVWHLAGNMKSRFTDFLTTDGEKPWRNREEEFASRTPTRAELLQHWQHGWGTLFDALSRLTDAQLEERVTIRGVELRVHEALHRSLAHASYHVGQIVLIARALRGPDWKYLSVPPGGSEAYNRNPTSERADTHANRLQDRG